MIELVNQLNALCDEQPFKTRWYLKNLKTGEEADRDGDVAVYSASTRKIMIMMATLKEVNEGRLSLDDPFTVEKQYQNTRSGCLKYFEPGREINLYEAIVMMIIVSDNVCTGKIVDMLGADKINAYAASVGMKETKQRQSIPDPNLKPEDYAYKSNATSANDVGLLLDLMVKGTSDPESAAKLGVTPEQCELGLEIMTWQKLGKLDQMLPWEPRVACKTGWGPAHHHDAGVIYQGDKPLFIMTAYTEDVAQNYPHANGKFLANNHIAKLARTAWDALAD